MKYGSLCGIKSGAQLFPDELNKISQPSIIDDGMLGVFLDSDRVNSWLFMKMLTPIGIRWINSEDVCDIDEYENMKICEFLSYFPRID